MPGRRRFIVARSLVSEMLPTLLLTLGITTFLLLIRSLFALADLFISHSGSGLDALKLMALGLPHVLVLTVPMATLFAVLLTTTRLSADCELVAAQACGISLTRMIRPLLLAAAVLCGIDLFFTLYVMPRSNRALQGVTSRLAFSGARSMVVPKVFIEDYTGRLLYVDKIDKDTREWHGVLLFDLSNALEERLVVADTGEVVVDPRDGRSWLDLHNATVHHLKPDEPNSYQQNLNRELNILLEVPSESGSKRKVGSRETLTTDLIAQARDTSADSESRVEAEVELQKRLAIPAAAIAFALVGFPLGVHHRRGGKGYGLTVSVALVVAYYVLLNAGDELARSQKLPIFLGVWLPNSALSLTGLLLLRLVSSRVESAAQHRFSLARLRALIPFRRARGVRLPGPALAPPRDTGKLRLRYQEERSNRPLFVSLLSMGVLDRNTLRQCVTYFLAVLVVVLAISVAVDLSEKIDHIQENHVPLVVVVSFYAFMVPQIVHDILPLAFLISFLAVAAVLEKTNATTALKAAGISLSRAALPMLVAGLALGAGLFVMDESVVQRANRANQRLDDIIHGRVVARSYRATDRPYMFLPDGRTLVSFLQFDADTNTLLRPSIYVFDDHMNLRARYMALKATYEKGKWRGEGAWSRTLLAGTSPGFVPHAAPVDLPLAVDSSYFGREFRKPSQMSFGELRDYIATLRAGGYRVDRFVVQLHTKLAYPLSVVVLSWVALPFAFRMGRRGTLMGVAVALGLGVAYFGVTAIVTKLGEASLLSPALAAWSPTVIFALVAMNGQTRVRT